MSMRFVLAIAALAGAMLMAAPAAKAVDFTHIAFAQIKQETSIPVGHADFCRDRPSECRPHADVVGAMSLTEQRWQDLVTINAHYNDTIVPVTDQDYYQVAEFWTYPTEGYGDCEDFALAKRAALIAAGWPASTLLLTVVREANGNGHAVLMVRTDRGDLILDNQQSRIELWTDTPYTYLKRQSQADAGRWVDFVDGNAVRLARR
ncbi:Predicted transglutaminase-like cysteine proteinase [Devosia enhydra]|uniref:Predicted transglutaminase-like cysteine proteinase n=2 Tax=Devosia enhydra TaxID=665118 RepID=A0A1K2HWY0_9HYPH|nr:Predicted transglutaminase-like cysteine proteinase [Devosia enhydra]